jgi:predicted DNA-binding transcriptional regulator AlpA
MTQAAKNPVRPVPDASAAQVVKIPQACQLMQISRATLYRSAANDALGFPKIRKIGVRASGIRLADIHEYLSRSSS